MESFEDVLRAAAREVFPGEEAHVDGIHLRLTRDGTTVAEYLCSIPERNSRGLPFSERVAATVEYLRAFDIEDTPGSEVPWDRLMPLVRPAQLVLNARVASKVAWRPLAEHLVTIVGVDHPEVTKMVVKDDAESWGVGREQLDQAARENFRRCEYRTSIEPIGATGQGAAFVVSPYGYEPSWLTMPEVFARPIGAVANPVYGMSRQLVFPVSRNEIFVLPEADEEAVAAAMRYAAEIYIDDPRAMLPFPLVVEHGRLRAWRRAGTRLGEIAWAQRRRYVRDQYEAQTTWLNDALRNDPQPPDPPPTVLPVAGQGMLPTAVEVEEGAGQLVLPEVEYLDLRSTRGRVVVPWPQAEEILGLELLPGWWPMRWTVAAWPPHPGQWEALRRAQVDPEVLDREPLT
ncbi:MAG: hypothetical protein Q4C85_02830 [Actinomyces sp.]|uniref:hypothetical protein n=1 Tax=Actinomyces sp. TaxID=29317 RepID=UPI0026DAFA25|nr:hypothetical protein [Actinomyces sp.]MDO4242690.1 hypothetical protein [Actinomyces sp.]